MGVHNKKSTILLVVSFILLLSLPAASTSSLITQDSSPNYTAQYSVLGQTLTISIPPSLYTYYNNQSHSIPQTSDYANFITPQTVQPIADSILKLTQNLSYPEEQFANAALSFVHQIPYNITGAKFPVETMVENRGDCGALSLLAASIMKAGGLDVVLIKYTGAGFAHMNIGVYLPQAPVYTSLFFSSTSFEYNNKTYWTAEATPQIDWKVGDQSPEMSNTITEIVPVDECEQSSPGQVSCSLSSLGQSTISLDVLSSPPDAQSNRSLLISGSTEPSMPFCPITIYFNKAGSTNFSTTATDDNGSYAFLWNFTSDGTYYISASFSGNGTFAGADSKPVMVFIGPPSLLQFQSETYNYFFGVPIGDVAIRPYIGVKDFLNTQVQSNVSFSYSFSVLSTGRAPSDIQTKSVTLPGSQYTTRDRNRSPQIIQVPPKTLTVPEDIPPGLQALALPSDFNQTINSQFCFIVQKQPEGNCTFGAQGLDGYDINGIKESNQTTVFFNATHGISESAWYRVSTAVSQNGVTADIQNLNGSRIQDPSAPQNLESSSQIVLLVANNLDSAIVLKDFQINNGTPPIEPTSQNVHQLPAPAKSLLPFAIAVVVIAAMLVVTGVIIDIRKTRKRQQR